MDTYEVIRNSRRFGPYTAPELCDMVSEGRVLRCDMVAAAGGEYRGLTVGDVLRGAKMSPRVRSNKSFGEQLRALAHAVVPPREDFSLAAWKADGKLLMLAFVGLLPVTLELFGASSYLTFYTIALYFSSIWGLFFYYLFKTRQVTLRMTLYVFFLTQAFVFVAWDVLGLPRLNPCYWFEGARGVLGHIVYFIGGVGLTEELAKAAPLLLIAARARQPLVPQTLVYYGLMSGIAFGVFEGVQYQLTVNAEYGYSQGFLMNIARLTSLPFIHAIWAGTAGYFVSFALLYPAYRWALWTLAVAVPAVQHGCYDIACNLGLLGWVLRIAIMFLSVMFLIGYLRRGQDMQRRLSQMTRE